MRLALVAVGTSIFLLVVKLSGNDPNKGAYFFTTVQILLFFFCATEGIRATSDTLSEEERQGTLGLLFLTRLRGLDVVLGKMVSSSLSSFFLLLGMFPLSGMALLLGGVSIGEYLRTNLILVCFLFFCLSIGMFVSSRVVREGVAGACTLFLICSACVVPEIVQANFPRTLGISIFSPFNLFWNSISTTGNSGLRPSLFPLVPISVISLLLLWASGRRIEKFRSTLSFRARETKTKKASSGRMPGFPAFRQKWLAREPVAYLFVRHRRFLWFVGVIAAIGFLSGISNLYDAGTHHFVFYRGWADLCLVILMVLLIFRTASFLNLLRESGSLELLLTTPLTPQRIIRGIHLGLNRSIGIAMLVVTAGIVLDNSPSFFVGQGIENAAKTFVIPFLKAAAYYYSYLWVAMAFGLSERKTFTAFFKTLLVVLVVPYIFALIFMIFFRAPFLFEYLWVVNLIWSLVFYSWGSRKVIRLLANWAELGNPRKTRFFSSQSSFLTTPKLPPPVPK
ncbi:MAG: hypothetical protein JWM04_766 [Verrucomicrobiales bacterium]|nr:hypothetical protein [Verrucomicrobiales bacterium]